MASKLSERLALVAIKDPISVDNVTVATAYVDTKLFSKLLFGFSISGAADVTAAVRLYKASDTNGTGSASFATAAIATTTVTTRQHVIPVDIDNLDPAKPYVKGEIQMADSSNTVLGCIMGFGESRYSPVESFDLSTVTVVSY